ncbi:ABC transporter permease [Abyssisolibacter fermentans]|uniref:ABC transporter permease n=1 Tax=Abyssisolibacter fermentans TaxID=1766203 RepID=UPI00082EFCEC|nr:ABC transporter permease [Abyssisolibacter fermentans]
MKKILNVIWASCILQMKQSFARATFKFCIIVQPIIYGMITYLMYRNSGHDNFVSFVILGTGFMSLWSSICFSSAGDIERERYMGTLEIITSVPSDFRIIMLGKIFGNIILGLLSMFITFIFVTFTFSVKMNIIHPYIFFAVFVLTIISFIGISMLLASSFTLSRNARGLMNCLEYPIFILCGIVFPISVLPSWTAPISYILSPTWSLKILRMCVSGIKDVHAFYMYLIILIILTIIYSILAVFLFNKIDQRTRIKATLGVY